MSTNNGSNRVGEVVEAATSEFVAQCYRLYQSPPLGALVRTGGETPAFGIVRSIATQSLDPGRRTIARGEDEEKEEDVYASHPQLSRLLRTDFQAIVVGFIDGNDCLQHLPPLPPHIHSFVYQCSPEELHRFTQSLDFFPLLLNGGRPSNDQVVAAFLSLAGGAYEDPTQFLLRSGRELALLMADQAPRLNTILKRLAL